MTITAGTRLGPYEIVSRIGAGGMGEVWKARDTRLDRSVAVKILAAEFAADAQLKIRFEREARTISQLEHPHICRLYDVGDEYLVMELLDGESLAQRLTKGPLPLHEVLRYGAQIADALDRAHRAGVIHRDLKPGNIMLTKSGAKLLDFGLAKSTVVIDVDGATVQKQLTQEGTILGTFQYMAPEQLEGTEADARTDIFAFGAVLYEMATGLRAFEGKTKTSLIAAIVKEHPRPLAQVQPLTPPALDHLIQRCLEKDADDRWQSARDVAEELRWISEAGSQAGVATPVVARRKTRERLAWIIAAVAAAGFATTGTLYLRLRQPPPVYSFTVPRADGRYMLAGPAVVSPDGTQLCFTARTSEEKPRQIFLRSIASFDVRALDGTEQVGWLAWSADGRSILFTADRKLKAIEIEGGAARTIAETKDIIGFAMNAGGDVLLGNGLGGLRRVPVGGGTPETITTPDRSRHEVYHSSPEFLPDGKRFLFISFVRDPSKREQPHYLYAGSLDSKEVRLLGEIPSEVRYVDPGYLLFVRDGTLMAVRFDADSFEIGGDPQPIAEGVSYFKPVGSADFSASRNGVVSYRASFEGESLVFVDRTGRRGASVGSVGDFSGFRISQDGGSVFAPLRDPKIGTPDLWSFGTRRETASRLTFDEGFESNPVPTLDGKLLFYSSDRLGIPDIVVKRVGSAEDDRPFVTDSGEQYANDVSPDGRFLIFESDVYAGGRDDLMLIPTDGSAKPLPFVKTPFSEWGARFSPDGKLVAYHSDASGKVQIYVKAFPGPGEARQISTRRGSLPRWSPDGRQLYFRDWNKVYVADIGSPDSEPRLLFETDRRFDSYEVMPDGERFLMSMIDEQAFQNPTRVIVNWPQMLRRSEKTRR